MLKLNSKNINKKINFKYLYLVTTLIGTIFLLTIMGFLYFNVYKTLTQAEIVSDLKTKVIQKNIDIKKINKIIDKINQKTNCSEIKETELRDSTIFIE